MKVKIERAVLKRMKIKDVVTGQLFVLSETSDSVLMKIGIRGGNDLKPLADAIPANKRLIVSFDGGYCDLVDEDLEVLPVEGELSGRIMTL